MQEAVDMLRQLEDFDQFSEMSDVVSRLQDKLAISRHNRKPIIHFDSVPNLEGIRLLNPLYNYIAHQQTLRIMYQSFNARKPTEFILCPYLLKEFRNRWTVPGDEAKTDIPVIASQRQNRNDTNLGFAYSAYNFSTARIAKGDFVRMKEISLGYDFPKSWLSKFGFQTLGIKLQATNLFLLYADKKLNGQDPEFTNAGGVAVPMPKQFTCTLRFGL
jgi:hypothetical protein